MPTIKVIKVVERRKSGALISFNNPDSELAIGGSVVHYSPGIVSVPNGDCGDLCAFRSMKTAKAFLKLMNPVRPCELWRARGTRGELGKAFDRFGTALAEPPDGTIFLSTIVLTEKIGDAPSRFE
jgi:hypothetical protein